MFMEFEKAIKKMSETYEHNIKEIEKPLLNVGINIRKNETEYKLFSEIIDELSNMWTVLSKEENKFIKVFICEKIAGIRDRNYLITLVNNKKCQYE
jgi:DNA-binding ferritin-like protein (Dps family)